MFNSILRFGLYRKFRNLCNIELNGNFGNVICRIDIKNEEILVDITGVV